MFYSSSFESNQKMFFNEIISAIRVKNIHNLKKVFLQNNNEDIVKYLTAHSSQGTILHQIMLNISNVDKEIFKILWQKLESLLNQEQICSLIQFQGHNINSSGDDITYGRTVLHLVANNSENSDMFYFLLKQLEKLNAINDVINIQDQSQNTLMHLAIEHKTPKMIKKLLIYPALDINKQDIFGNTALHYAIEEGKIDHIKEIVADERVDLSVKNLYNETVLDLANDSKTVYSSQIVDLISSYIPEEKHLSELDVNTKKIIFDKIENEDLNFFRHMTIASEKFIVDYPMVVLQFAVYYNVRIFKCLYEKITKDNDNIRVDNKGATILNAQDENGNTLIMLAALINHVKMFKFLLTKYYHTNGLKNQEHNINIQNKLGDRVIHIIIKNSNTKMLYKLQTHKALLTDYNSENNDHNTPMHIALSINEELNKSNKKKIIIELFKEKIDCFKINGKGKSIKQLAQETNDKEIIGLVKDKYTLQEKSCNLVRFIENVYLIPLIKSLNNEDTILVQKHLQSLKEKIQSLRFKNFSHENQIELTKILEHVLNNTIKKGISNKIIKLLIDHYINLQQKKIYVNYSQSFIDAASINNISILSILLKNFHIMSNNLDTIMRIGCEAVKDNNCEVAKCIIERFGQLVIDINYVPQNDIKLKLLHIWDRLIQTAVNYNNQELILLLFQSSTFFIPDDYFMSTNFQILIQKLTDIGCQEIRNQNDLIAQKIIKNFEKFIFFSSSVSQINIIFEYYLNTWKMFVQTAIEYNNNQSIILCLIESVNRFISKNYVISTYFFYMLSTNLMKIGCKAFQDQNYTIAELVLENFQQLIIKNDKIDSDDIAQNNIKLELLHSWESSIQTAVNYNNQRLMLLLFKNLTFFLHDNYFISKDIQILIQELTKIGCNEIRNHTDLVTHEIIISFDALIHWSSFVSQNNILLKCYLNTWHILANTTVQFNNKKFIPILLESLIYCMPNDHATLSQLQEFLSNCIESEAQATKYFIEECYKQLEQNQIHLGPTSFFKKSVLFHKQELITIFLEKFISHAQKTDGSLHNLNEMIYQQIQNKNEHIAKIFIQICNEKLTDFKKDTLNYLYLLSAALDKNKNSDNQSLLVKMLSQKLYDYILYIIKNNSKSNEEQKLLIEYSMKLQQENGCFLLHLNKLKDAAEHNPEILKFLNENIHQYLTKQVEILPAEETILTNTQIINPYFVIQQTDNLGEFNIEDNQFLAHN